MGDHRDDRNHAHEWNHPTILESCMLGNGHVQFGGGKSEKCSSNKATRWLPILHRGALWDNAASRGLLSKQSSRTRRDEESSSQIHSGLQHANPFRAPGTSGRAAQPPGFATRRVSAYPSSTGAGPHLLCDRVYSPPGSIRIYPLSPMALLRRGGACQAASSGQYLHQHAQDRISGLGAGLLHNGVGGGQQTHQRGEKSASHRDGLSVATIEAVDTRT